ncbi:MAG: hypothetical protein EPO24_03585 [Bacteroidetes bacterium]|nr:MAG: hypothetical protein EPO24_03585 [Bacteroidota bacterium]
MQGRSLAILLTGTIAIGSYIQYNMLQSSNKLTQNVVNYTARQTTQNIAQTGVYMGLKQLALNKSWRAGFTNMPVMNGILTVRVVDTIFGGQSAIGVFAYATVPYSSFGNSDQIPDSAGYSRAYIPKGFIPATVKAAITTNNPVTTLGKLWTDGRDHDLNGNFLANQGTLGIWTTKTYSQSGSSKTGGTDMITRVDYTPSKPANVNSYKTSAVWPAGEWPGYYPGSPDSIMGGPSKGYSEGTLKAIAQSGLNGSQYTTNPSTLSYPLKGVTYVELSNAGVWNPADVTGEGILIVHNQWKNAAMKNWNWGTFRGLMIIDDPVHIHTIVIGAIIGLTPSPSEGNCIGNGNGYVYFSNEAISNATGSITGSSSGSCDAQVLAWWE